MTNTTLLNRDNLQQLGPTFLRNGLASPGEIAALLAELTPSDALRVAWAFSALDDDLIVGLAKQLATRSLPLLPIATTLLERGLVEEALEFSPAVNAGQLAMALSHTAPAKLERWIEQCVEELRQLVNNDAPTLTLLEVAEVAIPFVPAHEQRAIVGLIEPRFHRELANGEYNELMYAYGEIDPGLRMARVLVNVGQADKVLAILDEREKAYGAFFNFEEMAAARRLLELMEPSPREQIFWRFRDWAKGADANNYKDRRYEAQWLVYGLDWHRTLVHRALYQLVADAPGATPFFSIVHADLPAELHEHMCARLIELVEDVMPHATQPDQGRHVWELLSAVQVLARAAHGLSIDQRHQLADPARRWASWYVSSSGTNGLEQLQTAVGWASCWRSEIEPAVKLIFDTFQGGNHYLLRVADWEALFSPDRLARIIESL